MDTCNVTMRRQLPADLGYIHVRLDTDVAYWTRELGLSETQLRDAVGAVGPHVVDVKKYMGRYLV